MTTTAPVLPTAADFLIPDPPAGKWRVATAEEWQAAERAGAPTAYVEWVAGEDIAMTAHFITDPTTARTSA